MFPNAPLGSFTAATRRSGSGRGDGIGGSYLQQQTNRTVPVRPGGAGAADRCWQREGATITANAGRGQGKGPGWSALPTRRAGPEPAKRSRLSPAEHPAGPAPRILRLDGLRGRAGLSPTLHMEGRAGSAVGAAGQLSGVQFQSPDLLGPTRPALQLLLAVTQRLRIHLGLLRDRRWGQEGERSGQERSGVPGRPPAPCARHRAAAGPRSSQRLCQSEDKEGLQGSTPRHPPAAARGEVAAFAPNRSCARSAWESSRERGRTDRGRLRRGQSRARGLIPRGKCSEAHPALGRAIFRRVSLHRFLITTTTTTIIIITIIIITIIVIMLGEKGFSEAGKV